MASYIKVQKLNVNMHQRPKSVLLVMHCWSSLPSPRQRQVSIQYEHELTANKSWTARLFSFSRDFQTCEKFWWGRKTNKLQMLEMWSHPTEGARDTMLQVDDPSRWLRSSPHRRCLTCRTSDLWWVAGRPQATGPHPALHGSLFPFHYSTSESSGRGFKVVLEWVLIW